MLGAFKNHNIIYLLQKTSLSSIYLKSTVSSSRSRIFSECECSVSKRFCQSKSDKITAPNDQFEPIIKKFQLFHLNNTSEKIKQQIPEPRIIRTKQLKLIESLKFDFKQIKEHNNEKKKNHSNNEFFSAVDYDVSEITATNHLLELYFQIQHSEEPYHKEQAVTLLTELLIDACDSGNEKQDIQNKLILARNQEYISGMQIFHTLK